MVLSFTRVSCLYGIITDTCQLHVWYYNLQLSVTCMVLSFTRVSCLYDNITYTCKQDLLKRLINDLTLDKYLTYTCKQGRCIVDLHVSSTHVTDMGRCHACVGCIKGGVDLINTILHR